MKTIPNPFFNTPKSKYSILLFPRMIFHIHHSLDSTTEVSITTRQTWSHHHQCCLLVSAFVWAEGGGSITQPPPLPVRRACSFFAPGFQVSLLQAFSHRGDYDLCSVLSIDVSVSSAAFVTHSHGFHFEFKCRCNDLKLIDASVYCLLSL